MINLSGDFEIEQKLKKKINKAYQKYVRENVDNNNVDMNLEDDEINSLDKKIRSMHN